MLAADTPVAWAQTLVWPVVITAIAAALLFTRVGRTLIVTFFQRVRKMSVFGVSFELTPEAAKLTEQALEDVFVELRPRVTRECQRRVRQYEITSRFEIIAQAIHNEVKSMGRPVGDYRATLYVEDPLVNGQLLQLLDY